MEGDLRKINVPRHDPADFGASWNNSGNPIYLVVRTWSKYYKLKYCSNQKMFLFLQSISGQYLQPYTSGGSECASLTNCMLCMTDASCGWCPLTNKCESRSSSTVCKDAAGHIQHLVLNATDCFRCSEFINCASCTQVRLNKCDPSGLLLISEAYSHWLDYISCC